MQQELSAEDESDRDTQTREGAAFELAMGSSRFSIQKGYCCTFTVVSIFSYVRWTIGESLFPRDTDAYQSVLSRTCFELVSGKRSEWYLV